MDMEVEMRGALSGEPAPLRAKKWRDLSSVHETLLAEYQGHTRTLDSFWSAMRHHVHAFDTP